MKKGSKMTPESIERLRRSHLLNPNRYWLGKKRPDIGKKLSAILKGRRNLKNCHPRSQETKDKISLTLKGKLAGNKNPFYGRKHKPDTINKIRQTKLGKPSWNAGKKAPQLSGSNSGSWKGGITPLNLKIRSSLEYKQWRKMVFERDNYTCQWCRRRGCRLNADHIRPFRLFPELRFDTNNGRTLCIDCHRNTSSYSNRNVFQLDLL